MTSIQQDENNYFVLDLYPIRFEEQLEDVCDVLVRDFGAQIQEKSMGPGTDIYKMAIVDCDFILIYSSISGLSLRCSDARCTTLLTAIGDKFNKLLS